MSKCTRDQDLREQSAAITNLRVDLAAEKARNDTTRKFTFYAFIPGAIAILVEIVKFMSK